MIVVPMIRSKTQLLVGQPNLGTSIERRLAFNERVLDQVFHKNTRFLREPVFSLRSSNLDQFYEIRVAGLMQRSMPGSPTAWTAAPRGSPA